MKELSTPQQELGLPPPSWRDVVKSVLFIALAVGVAYYVTVRIGIDDLRESVAAFGVYAPLVIIILKATTLVVVPLGGTPIYPIAGALFGFWQGLTITLIGDVVGSTISFFISRRFGGTILRFFMTREQVPIVERLVARVSEPGRFIRARLFFIGFPDLFAYAAGLTKISYPFFIIVHIGIHALFASLAVLFGDLLVSGSKLVIIGVGLLTSLLAFVGVWWFHADLKRSS